MTTPAAGDAHKYPVWGYNFRLTFPILDADGDLVAGATGLDSEISSDSQAFSDLDAEATEIATSSGMYFLDIGGNELRGKIIATITKTTSSGAKTTPITLYPIRLPVLETGTAQGGGSGTIQLATGASQEDDFYNGLFVGITNNTPAGVQYQLRRIIDYVGGGGTPRQITIDSDWGMNPTSSTTYELLIPEGYSTVAWGGIKVGTATNRGLTALPAAVADAAGGLPISDAGELALDDRMISAAATANLEDMFDGTGYFEDFAPAFQLQLAGLSGGLAISQTAESSTLTATGGTETNTYAATAVHDGTNYDVTDFGSGDGISFVLQFDIGGDAAIPVSLHFHGWFEDPAADSGVSIAMQAYNYNTSAYETIHTLEDVAAEEEHMVPLTLNNVGTVAADPGIVRIRFLASGQAADNVIHIDHCAVDFVNGLRTDSDGYVLLSGGTGTGQVALTSGAVATDAASRTASKANVSALATTSALNTHDGKLDTLTTTVGTAGVGLTDLGGMSTGMKAEVNAEVVDALNTDTYAEPGQGAPGATVSLAEKLGYLYKAWRNKSDQDSSTYQLYADDASTVDQKATMSEAGGTVTKGEIVTGP